MSIPALLQGPVGLMSAGERRVARLGRVRSHYRFPDFLGLGSAQSGSTWLFDNLAEHPDVALPSRKELNYWDQQSWKPLWWYVRFFRDAGPRLTGEVSPGYCFLPRTTIREIRALMPDVRLVYIVRNPVDREWSRARRIVGRRMQSEGRSLADVNDEEWLRYLERRRIARHSDHPSNIDRWLEVFPGDQLQLIFFDQLAREPEQVFRDTVAHLGLTPWAPPGVAGKVNMNPAAEMPEVVHDWLSRRFAPVIREMADRYGDDAEAWLVDLPR